MPEPVLIEVCVDSVESALASERGGAQRLELCSDLLEGGVTPSLGLLRVVRQNTSIPVHVIIRPRPGDFSYSDAEFEVMRRDIEVAKNEGVDGVVLGILSADGNVDIARSRQLVQLARPLSVTFHRAFDLAENLFGSLEDVCATGVDRLLTSGGEQECVQGIDTIARLVKQARGRISIMAGGSIRAHNAATIVERTGVREIHVGLGTPVKTSLLGRNPGLTVSKVQDIVCERTQVLEENVRQLHRAVSSCVKATPE